jgi:hypothetical protein
LNGWQPNSNSPKRVHFVDSEDYVQEVTYFIIPEIGIPVKIQEAKPRETEKEKNPTN